PTRVVVWNIARPDDEDVDVACPCNQ
ncbi:MAG: hypothetical protein K0S82_1095, partial [Gaiellaceae bacterium]|nr:hypothetical protein [Gaiellaceae bacterium]